MQRHLIVVSEQPDLRQLITGVIPDARFFNHLSDLSTEGANALYLIDASTAVKMELDEILTSLMSTFLTATPCVILMIHPRLKVTNAMFTDYPFLMDVYQFSGPDDHRLAHRLRLLDLTDQTAVEQAVQDREREYQQIIYQLNEIFQFEDNLQLNFFEMDIFNVVQLVLTKISNSIHADMVLFFKFDVLTQNFSFTSSTRNAHQDIEMDIKSYSDPLLKELVLKQMPIMRNTVETADPFLLQLQERFSVTVEKFLMTPVYRNDQLFGIIAIINKKYHKLFTEVDIAFSQVSAAKISDVLDQQLSWYSFASDNNTTQELVRERDNLRDILNKMEFAIIIFDRSNTIHFCNEFVNDLLGIPRNRKISKLDHVFNDDTVTLIQKEIAQLRNEPINQEFLISDGPENFKRIGYTISKYLISEIDEVGYIFTFKDITQMTDDKASMYRVDKLASLGILASGIAHEIRNPLAGIKTMAETLSDELQNEEQREYTDRIVRQVNRLSSLLKSFFSYAKPTRPEKTATEINELIHEVLPILKNRLQSKKIDLSVNIEQNLEPIKVDSSQIQQVIFNILLNAIDAMPTGGKLAIHATPSINLSEVVNKSKFKFRITNARYLELMIKDDGAGMTEDQIDKIFDPFFTTKAEGTGLGMAIVYQIINEHDAFIDIKSKIGKGTEVRIFLPYST